MENRFRFRFWHNEYKKMVEVFNFGIDGGCCEWVQHSPIYNTEDGLPILDNWGGVMEEPSKIIRRSKLVNGVLEQCTGLKDKNGKLIFEGDIVREYGIWHPIDLDDQEIDYLFVVKWSECSSMFGFLFPRDRYGKKTTFEVIGNVHDNKELLQND